MNRDKQKHNKRNIQTQIRQMVGKEAKETKEGKVGKARDSAPVARIEGVKLAQDQ